VTKTKTETLALLPVRETVLFPQAIAPLVVGRERSVRLLESLGGDKVVAVVAQRDPTVDKPGPSELYAVGTAGVVHKVARLPNENLYVFIEGNYRIRILEVVQYEPFLRARVERLDDVSPAQQDAEYEALQRNVRELFQQIVAATPNLSDELQAVAANLEDGGRLADFVASSLLSLTTPVRQELLEDLCRPAPMLRLLQGDVGCGKTVVAASVMAAVAQSGYQVALMAPTELLAQQHARVLAEWFEPLGVPARLLSQAVPTPERTALQRQIAQGAVKIVVGTHALIQSTVSFANLGLVVIDEQHKFGVVQRSALARKGQELDVLVMTATPIPRTLALSLYGDLACSTITELPPGRLPVRTEWHGEADRAAVYARIQEQLELGRQAYVVYPVIEASSLGAELPHSSWGGLKAATQMAKHLKSVFTGFTVELLP